jgi:hypothetical protein
MELRYTKSKTVGKIYTLLQPLLEREEMPEFDEIVDAIEIPLTQWRDSIVGMLEQKIAYWDVVQDGKDETLYTLGLRQTIDILNNYDTIEESKKEALGNP